MRIAHPWSVADHGVKSWIHPQVRRVGWVAACGHNSQKQRGSHFNVVLFTESCELEVDVRICIGIGTRDGSHAKASLCSRHGPRAAVGGTAGLQDRFARFLCVQLMGFQEILDVCSSEEDALCCAVPHKLNGISVQVFYCSNARQVHVARPLGSGTGASLYQGVGRR